MFSLTPTHSEVYSKQYFVILKDWMFSQDTTAVSSTNNWLPMSNLIWFHDLRSKYRISKSWLIDMILLKYYWKWNSTSTIFVSKVFFYY